MNEWAKSFARTLVSRLPEQAQEALTRYGLSIVNRSGLRKTTVTLWHGPMGQAGQIRRLLVAGDDPWVQYLPQRFFTGEAQHESLGLVPVRSLPQFLERLQGSVDMTIARVDRHTGKRIFPRDYLAVPEWVGTRMTVPDNVDTLVRSSSNIQRDVRRIRRQQFQPVVSLGDEGVESFYQRFYLPLSKVRYQELLVMRPADDLRRRARRGGIVWNQREGQAVSALLFETKGRSLDVLAVGARDGDLTLVKEGAIAALYYFVVGMACNEGYRTIDFRGSRPALTDGVLRYKSKWGASLYDKTDSYHDLFIRWGQAPDVAMDFLSHTPLIFRESGGFSALLGNAGPNEQDLWVGGLQRWYRLCGSEYREISAVEGRPAGSAAGVQASQSCRTESRRC